MTSKLLIRDRFGEREMPLVGVLTVGRDPACEIYDADPMLSRRHAQFIPTERGVMVKDLDSQNGVLVNGVRVQEAVLESTDVARIAHLHFKVVREVADVAPEGADADDKTAPLDGPPPNEEPPAPVDPGGDATRFVLPGAIPAEPPVAAAAPPVVPVAPPVAPAPPAARARARGAKDERPASAPAAVRAEPAGPAKAHVARGSWLITAMTLSTALVVAVLAVAVIPTLWWHDGEMARASVGHASALANWLRVDARLRLENGQPLGDAADAVLKRPGVVAALVMTPDGRVLAPGSRVRETVTTLEGLGVAPADIFAERIDWNGDRIEVAIPVESKDRPRAAIAWLAVRPADMLAGGMPQAAVLGPVCAVALGLGLLTAFILARRPAKAITLLNEDLDLALAGRLEHVGDPLGSPAVKNLADTLNYLVTRLHSPGHEAAPASHSAAAIPAGAPKVAAASRGGPVAPRAVASAVAPAGAPEPRAVSSNTPVGPAEATLVVDQHLRIGEAGPECESVLGVAPSRLVGEHLFGAFPDARVLDAVVRCLGNLPSAGEEMTAVGVTGGSLRIRMRRAGKDQPVTISVRRESS